MQLDSKLFEERLKEAVRPEPLNRWCDRVGVSYSTLNSAFRRKAIPNTELVAQISIALGKSVDWLLGLTNEPSRMLSYGAMLIEDQPRAIPHGESESAEEQGTTDWSEFVQVPLYDVSASAGHGAFAPSHENVDRYLAFRRDFIQGVLGLNSARLYCIKIRGVSMEPLLRNGHPALVDPDDNEVLSEGPHFLRMEGALLVKNLQRLPGARLRIWSENQTTSAYAPIELDWPPREGVDLQVLGRLRWSDCIF